MRLRLCLFGACSKQNQEKQKKKVEKEKTPVVLNAYVSFVLRHHLLACLLTELRGSRVLPVWCRPKISSAMFFKYNTSLGPPFHIIVDTNFINFAIKNKLDVVRSMMDCLLAKCALHIYCVYFNEGLFSPCSLKGLLVSRRGRLCLVALWQRMRLADVTHVHCVFPCILMCYYVIAIVCVVMRTWACSKHV